MSAPPPNGAAARPNVPAPVAAPLRKKPAVSIFAAHKKKPIVKAKAPPKPLQPIQRSAPKLSSDAPKPEGPSQEYPIFIRKKDLDLRYHVMKFQGQAVVNPYDDTQFSRPLRLFRRAASDRIEVAAAPGPLESDHNPERELMDARRAERQAEREENQKLIAPSGSDAVKPPPKKKQPKKFVNYDNDSFPDRQKRQQLRYEEARPWHLEDFDRKNIWIGNYEGPLSYQHALFLVEEGGFRMVPVEKYYRFSQTGKFNPMDADEAAKHMNQKFNMPRWAMGTKLGMDMARQQALQTKREEMEARRRIDRDDDDVKGTDQGEYQADKDALDIEWDDMNDFQDDDEGKLFEGGEDEDAKEIEQRIREEMRQAGLGGTGVKNEELDPEEEYRRQQLEEREEKRRTRRIRKQLGRREKKNEYLSESDDDPYSDDSDDDLSIEEEEDDDEKKGEDSSRLGLQSADKSGASSRASNTPNGRLEKRDPLRPNKRPGSPDLSDMSGNESSRKKAKGLNGRPSKTQLRVGRGGSGSGSESDTSRASGRPRIKLKASPTGTPDRSRAASPAAGAPAIKKELPTLDQVRAAIPADGIAIKDLVATFRNHIPAGMQSAFIVLVREAGQQDKVTKKIVPKVQS